MATGPLNCAKHTQSITSWSDPPRYWRKKFPRVVGVRHDLSDKVSSSFFSHGLSWPTYPATSFPASRSTLSCAGITDKPSLRQSRITDFPAIAWSKPHNASVWVCTPNPLDEALGPDADSRRQAYRRLFRAAMQEADLKAIRESLHQGWALGDPLSRADRAPERAPRCALTQGATEEK